MDPYWPVLFDFLPPVIGLGMGPYPGLDQSEASQTLLPAFLLGLVAWWSLHWASSIFPLRQMEREVFGTHIPKVSCTLDFCYVILWIPLFFLFILVWVGFLSHTNSLNIKSRKKCLIHKLEKILNATAEINAKDKNKQKMIL